MKARKIHRAVSEICAILQKRKISRSTGETVLMGLLITTMYDSGWEKDDVIEQVGDLWDIRHRHQTAQKLRVVK